MEWRNNSEISEFFLKDIKRTNIIKRNISTCWLINGEDI